MRYVRLTGTLIFGSVPLYLEHLFLNLIFPKTVSQCVGVAQSVVSALFLTGLGEGRWQFFRLRGVQGAFGIAMIP